MAALPYIQLYVAEYLADTSHLTCEEHGAYLLLIFNYWQRGKALDNSNGRLSNVVRLSNERWTEVSKALREFFTIEDDTWTHARVERDLAAVNAKCQKARESRSQRKSYERSTDDQRKGNHKKRIEENREEEKNTNTTDADAESVYELYPRRTGKKAAVKSIQKALKEIDIELLKKKVQKYAKQCVGKDPQFIPLPTTWFNQGRWEDESLLTVEERFVPAFVFGDLGAQPAE